MFTILLRTIILYGSETWALRKTEKFWKKKYLGESIDRIRIYEPGNGEYETMKSSKIIPKTMHMKGNRKKKVNVTRKCVEKK